MSAISLPVLEEAVARWRNAHPGIPCEVRYPEREGLDQSNEDYILVIEVSFSPHTLDQAQLEISVTHDGYVAIGVETWQRLSGRLGILTWKGGWLFGHEPSLVTMEEVEAVYAIASGGDWTIDCGRVLKLLTSARCPALEAFGLRSLSGWALTHETIAYRGW